jgi:hypothetical protein
LVSPSFAAADNALLAGFVLELNTEHPVHV